MTFTFQLLYPQEKKPWYPLDKSLGGPQNWSRQQGEEKILAPIRTQTLTFSHLAHSQSIHQLLYSGSPSMRICTAKTVS
jgi:hypothetical protein